MIENERIENNEKPTFKERIFGIPSSDEVSKLKFKINIVNIFFVIGIMILATSYFIEDSFRNRAVTITTEYEKLIKLPEIKIEAQSIYQDFNPVYLFYIEIYNEDNKQLLFCQYENFSIDGPTDLYKPIDLVGNSVNFTFTSLTLYPNDQFSVGFNQDINLVLGFLRFNRINRYYPFNISITVNNEESFLISSFESFNMGVSKTVKIDKYKNEVESFKTRISTIMYGYDIDDVAIIDSVVGKISYFTQIVTTETTQTDSEIYIEILSSVGSLISTVALVCGIGFSIITKFFIKEKDGWIDNEVRETIVYHANQLNEDNLIPTNDCNKENEEEKVHFIN
ncbi:hypothetical protein ACTFIV_002742 [Dictyostelium citrinum]